MIIQLLRCLPCTQPKLGCVPVIMYGPWSPPGVILRIDPGINLDCRWVWPQNQTKQEVTRQDKAKHSKPKIKKRLSNANRPRCFVTRNVTTLCKSKNYIGNKKISVSF